MKSRKPYHISRDKVAVSFCREHRDLLPTEIQKLSKLSRPTVFNVLKYFKDKGIVEQSGKKYRLTPFKDVQKPVEPLKGYWRFAYERHLDKFAEKNHVTKDMIPGWWKEIAEARFRNEAHFVKAWGLERMLEDLPGQKFACAFVTKNIPIDRDLNGWTKNQQQILRQLKKG
jgi:hypothetical protein